MIFSRMDSGDGVGGGGGCPIKRRRACVGGRLKRVRCLPRADSGSAHTCGPLPVISAVRPERVTGSPGGPNYLVRIMYPRTKSKHQRKGAYLDL